MPGTSAVSAGASAGFSFGSLLSAHQPRNFICMPLVFLSPPNATDMLSSLALPIHVDPKACRLKEPAPKDRISAPRWPLRPKPKPGLAPPHPGRRLTCWTLDVAFPLKKARVPTPKRHTHPAPNHTQHNTTTPHITTPRHATPSHITPHHTTQHHREREREEKLQKRDTHTGTQTQRHTRRMLCS